MCRHITCPGDFIPIRGSNSVPNIDGIHKVTKLPQIEQTNFSS